MPQKKGCIPWNKGLIYTKEQKKKMSEAGKKSFLNGRIHWNLGNKYSEEFKQKLSLAHKGQKAWNYIDGRSKNPKSRKRIYGKLFTHYVWCSQPENYWKIPDGCVIHHIDLNPENDNPKNLQLMDDCFHKKLHNQIFKELKRQEVIIQ